MAAGTIPYTGKRLVEAVGGEYLDHVHQIQKLEH